MDLQEKHYLCETNQAFCNICDKILCLSMSCAWLRKFQKRLKKAVQDHMEKPRDFDPFGQTGLPPLATI